jgi:hypothetical protein
LADGAKVSSNINHKLGPGIYAWSLPADEETCIGATPLCAADCYAKKGHFIHGALKRLYQRNKAFAGTEEFPAWLLGELRRLQVKVFRLHVSGDFFDIDYTEKWVEIAQRAVRVTFFAYTRSWRDPAVLPSLIRLSHLPNVRLWFSMDLMTGSPPLVPGVRRAYLATDDLDADMAPDDCDLVFRDRPTTVMKRTNGVLVCPAENGIKAASGFRHTCTTCQICWAGDARSRWQDLVQLDNVSMEEGIELEAPESANVSLVTQGK